MATCCACTPLTQLTHAHAHAPTHKRTPRRYSREELLLHWFIMFQELDLFNRFKIHPETLHNFFLTIGNTSVDACRRRMP